MLKPMSTNGILDELHPGGFAVFVQLYADEIYAPVVGEVLVAAQVREGRSDEFLFLGERY